MALWSDLTGNIHHSNRDRHLDRQKAGDRMFVGPAGETLGNQDTHQNGTRRWMLAYVGGAVVGVLFCLSSRTIILFRVTANPS